MAEYIRVNVEMQRAHVAGVGEHPGKQPSRLLQRDVSEREQAVLVRNQVANNSNSPLSLIGSLDHCAQRAEVLQENGVDEIACLVDFGIEGDEVMRSLELLSKLTAQ
jgi:hypothetical protein